MAKLKELEHYDHFEIHRPSNIIITAPHNGQKELDLCFLRDSKKYSKKECNKFNIKNDLYTRNITLGVVDKVAQPINYNIATVHRRFIDFNRQKKCATSFPPLQEIYQCYHDKIAEFKLGREKSLLLDIHGYVRKGKDNKVWKDICIGTKNYSTCDKELVEFVVSFFNATYKKGSAVDLGRRPLNGGYIVQQYAKGSKQHQAIQFEISQYIRKDESERKEFIQLFARLIDHLNTTI